MYEIKHVREVEFSQFLLFSDCIKNLTTETHFVRLNDKNNGHANKFG